MELKGNKNTAIFTYIIYVYYLFIDLPVLHVVNPIYPPMAIISRDSEGVNSVQGFSSSWHQVECQSPQSLSNGSIHLT